MIDAHLLPTVEVLKKLKTSTAGLSESEVDYRQKKAGLNTLPEAKHLKMVTLFISQFASTMVLLMMTAAALSLVFNHTLDAALIFLIVLVNGVMGFVQEFRAEQSVAALKKLLVTKVQVRRASNISEISHDQLVVGDIILLQEGSRVPADARILSNHNCYVIESILTGESLPVEKNDQPLKKQTGIADQSNMIWMGTTITQGTVEAVVTAIGSDTEFGKIAHEVESVSTEQEHFSQKMTVLTKQMASIAILSAVATFIVGYFVRGFSFADISIFTIATLVSALPEGLPIISVIVLAVGAQRMAKKNAIVRKLAATETLGVVSIIITDKTGTLTHNSMSAKSVYLPGQPLTEIRDEEYSNELTFYQDKEPLLLHENQLLRKLVSIAGVCHQVKISNKNQVTFDSLLGDPTEKALFLLAYKAGFLGLAKEHVPTIIDDLPFQQLLRMRACLVNTKKNREVFAIGAPENILATCNKVQFATTSKPLSAKMRQDIEKNMQKLSSQGLRVIALASFPAPTSNTLTAEHLETKDGIFIGLVGLYDPPRPEIASALVAARQAGIRVIMATGDHPQTALAIAKEIGLVNHQATQENAVLIDQDLAGKSKAQLLSMLKKVNVLARLTPQTKMRIAEAFQSQGDVVAMTGDGVNDAPALKKADVGIAMGVTGTDVAREASKIVLADDNFASIIAAVKEGRTQFNNLRRTSFFLIMTNIAESAALLFALLLGFPLPLLPIQILWLNVITGGFTDFALSLEPAHHDAMSTPPRSPKENILTPAVLPLIGAVILITTILSLAAFTYYLPYGVEKARTAVFVVLSFSQLLNMFNLRSLKKSVFEINPFSNKAILTALIISLGLLLSALWFAPLRSALHFTSLAITDLVLLMLASTSIFITAEIMKKFLRQRLTSSN